MFRLHRIVPIVPGLVRAARPLRVLWLATLLGCMAAAAPVVAALAQPGESRSSELVEDFNHGRIHQPEALIVNSGFHSGLDGWYLAPGTEGRLVYRVAKPVGHRLVAKVWMYSRPPQVTGQIRVGLDGGDLQTMVVNPQTAGGEIGLPPGSNGASRVDLEFSGINSSKEGALILDQLVWATRMGSPPAKPPKYSYWALGAVAALLALIFLPRRLESLLAALGLGVLVGLATQLRVIQLFAQVTTLDPDAVMYRLYGERFEWWPPWVNGLFSANFSEREPLFPLLAHLSFTVAGSSDFRLRVVSTTFSILVVVLSVAAARRRLSWPVSLAIGGLVALNGPLVTESARALRTEVEMFWLLVLYLVLDRAASRHPRREAVTAGLAGAALILTRTLYLPAVVAAAAIAALGRYRPAVRAIGLLAVMLVLTVGAAAGHRVAMHARTGDAFYDTAGYARWNANYEKFLLGRPLGRDDLFLRRDEYERLGTPYDEPTAAQLYGGPRITYGQYLFEIHTWKEVVAGTLEGYRDVFQRTEGFLRLAAANRIPIDLKPFGNAVDFTARWSSLAGLAALLLSAWRRPRNLILPALVILSLSQVTFLYHLKLVEPYRNTMVVYPLALIAGGWLIEQAIRLAALRFIPQRAGASLPTSDRVAVEAGRSS
jgi:hypothetical protein